MAVVKLKTIESFGKNEMFFDSNTIKQMLDKLAEQDKKLRVLQQNLLKERHTKESIQADFEHILFQLKSLQQAHALSKQIDVTYL